MKFLAFKARDGCSEIWIFCSISIPTPKVISNSDQEITLEFGMAPRVFNFTFIYASILILVRQRLWNYLKQLAL